MRDRHQTVPRCFSLMRGLAFGAALLVVACAPGTQSVPAEAMPASGGRAARPRAAATQQHGPRQRLQAALAEPLSIIELDLSRAVPAQGEVPKDAPPALESLPAAIGDFVNLTKLDVSGNALAELPAQIGKLTRLRVLRVRHNRLTALPPAIGELRSLEELDLSHNPLTALPDEVGNLAKLQKLSIRHTHVKTLPAALGNLAGLQVLDAYAAMITTLPAELEGLTSLRELDLTANEWRYELPEVVGKLTSLRVLRLRYTSTGHLSEGHIAKLENLELLDLERTRFIVVDDLQKALPNTKILYGELPFLGFSIHKCIRDPETATRLFLNSLDLSTLPAEVLQCRNLKEIELDKNLFTEFPKELFELENLERINIADNRVTTVPRDILELRKLKSMNICNNLLTEFPSVLLELPEFEGLAMYNNRLTELPDDFEKLRKLKVLRLAGNYFTREQYREFNRQLPDRFVGGATGDYDQVMFTYEEAKRFPDRVYLLGLDGMGLETLPPDITAFERLEVLNVNQNPLRELPKNLGKLKNLHFIYAYDTLLGDAAKKQLARTNPNAKLFLGPGEGL